MGCDIHSYVERKKQDGEWELVKGAFEGDDFDKEHGRPVVDDPFGWRSYGMFAFLAGVRNYSCVPVIKQPTYEIPEDSCKEIKEECEFWSTDGHNASFLYLEDLLNFDYEKTFEDRRCMRNNDGGSTCDVGEGKIITFREFLGPHFFQNIQEMKRLGDDPKLIRVVFWFDN